MRLPGLGLFARSRRAQPATNFVLGTYTGTNWYQRNRKKCLAALIFICFFYGVFWTLVGRFMMPVLMIPPAILLAGIIWMLPESDRGAPEHILAGGLIAYMLALGIWPDYIAIALPGLPWITMVRLVGVPLVFILLACLSVSAQARERTVAVLAPSPLIWKGVVAFAIIGLLTLPLSADISGSFSRYIVAQMNWTATFFIACIVFARTGDSRRFAAVLWIVAVVVCLIGVWEARISRPPWAGHLPSFLTIDDPMVAHVLNGTSRAGSGIYRVQSKFTTSLGLAEYLAMATPFIIHFSVAGRSAFVRAAAGLTLPLVAYIVYMTDSRLAALGLFISIALYVAFWSLSRWRKDPQSIAGALLTVGYPLIFAVMFAATILIGRIRAKIWGNGSQQASTDARRTMYEMGIPMILKNPIGNGFAQGGATLNYRNPKGTMTIDTYYLAVALEFGVIGFIVFYGMFLVAIWKAAWTSLDGEDEDGEWLGPAAISLFNFFVSKSVFSNTDNHALAFILLGMVVALVYRATKVAPVAETTVRTLETRKLLPLRA